MNESNRIRKQEILIISGIDPPDCCIQCCEKHILLEHLLLFIPHKLFHHVIHNGRFPCIRITNQCYQRNSGLFPALSLGFPFSGNSVQFLAEFTDPVFNMTAVKL